MVSPRQPVAAVSVAPSQAPVEFSDEHEPAVVSGVQVSGKLGDLGF